MLEHLLGIEGGNYDLPDAVGHELKTSLSSTTLVTLFHKDPKPRKPSVVKALVDGFGWEPTHKDKYPSGTLSFRHTIHGKSDRGFSVIVDDEKISIAFRPEDVDAKHREWLDLVYKRTKGRLDPCPYWTVDEIVSAASSKLRNCIFVKAVQDKPQKMVKYTNAYFLANFKPMFFLKCIKEGRVAIDFDARTKGKTVRNHGTKFRIKEEYWPHLFESQEELTIP